MTDTTVAADTGGAPDTAAPVTEVPINPSPVSAPSPLGPQAPQAPVGDVKGSPHHPKSARETIQDAYNRALNPPKPQRSPVKEAKEPPKAAEAKPGHNKPPEKTETFNLKKRPVEGDQPQPRGDHGRFTPRQEATADRLPLSAAEGDGAAPASQPTPSPAPAPLPHDAPFREPPSRMADHAKREWALAPESVRGEVHRIHKEYAQAYEQYRGAAEAFAPVAHYHQMAQQHGTTLQQALDNYVGMETKLRADPIAGLDLIVHNLGLKTPDGEPIGFRDIAYHVLSQTPEQLRSLQQGNTVNATQHQIGALHQQVAGLTNALQQMQYNQQYSYTRSAIDGFAEAPGHDRFDELSTTIDQELKSGYDLETAYRRAELLNPTTQAAQTRTPSAQTRPPDRSISGAPGGSTNGAAQPRRGEPRSLRDTIEHNARRVSNGF